MNRSNSRISVEEQASRKKHILRDELLKETDFQSNGVNVSSILDGLVQESSRKTTNRRKEDMINALCDISNSSKDNNKSYASGGNTKENIRPYENMPVRSNGHIIHTNNNPMNGAGKEKGTQQQAHHQNDHYNGSQGINYRQKSIDGGLFKATPVKKPSALNLPKNLRLSSEQVTFLSNIQNSVDVISQLKSKIELMRVEREQMEEDNRKFRFEVSRVKEEMEKRDASFNLLKKQANQLLEERNQALKEVSVSRKTPPEYLTKLGYLEKENSDLKSKNKKLLVDQQVLQEIIKEMVYEREQASLNAGTSDNTGGLDAYLGQKQSPELFKNSELYHSFGDLGLGS